jgi:TonB family protein
MTILTHKNLILLLLLLSSHLLFGQITKKYFKINVEETAIVDSANCYKIFDQRGKNLTITEFDLDGTKKKEYHFVSRLFSKESNDTIDIYEGPYTHWNILGKVIRKGNYGNDKYEGEQTDFHGNGKIKRQEFYKTGDMTWGKSFDSNGKEVTFVPYEEQPEFPAGQAALFRFLSENVKYPMKARRKGIEGTVYVGFVVNTTGEIVDVSVKRGVHSLLDAEASRVVALMPRWKAGKQEGVAVRVSYTLPIKFKLE